MKTRITIFLLAVAVVFLPTRKSSSSPMYLVTDLGTLGGTMSKGHGINNSGQVVGFSNTSSGDQHAFLYSGGVMQDLGTLGGGNNSVAYGINGSGQVTGVSNPDYHAFLYSGGVMQDLGTLGGPQSYGFGINDSGQLTGKAYTSSHQDAFLYSGGVMHDLGTLGGFNSQGLGINSSGEVVGNADTSSGDQHAFLYRGGVMQDLGTLGGGNYSSGFAINANGQVTGDFYPSSGGGHAFLYSGGVMQDLGFLGVGYGINAKGQMTGLANTGSGDRAFLYSGGVMKDLNSLIDPNSGWVLESGRGINDLGQITGYGIIDGQTHAFLLSPSNPVGDWIGTIGTNWADSGNWSVAVPGATVGTTNTDTAIFNQNAAHSPLIIDAGRNVQNIIFDTASVNSIVGTVGGQALLLTAHGAIQTTATVVNPQTVNAPLVLEGDYAFTSVAASRSATLSFGGRISAAATSGVTTLTLNGGNTGANSISSVLADNGLGKLAVTKTGTGDWILSGANTYSGDTTVSGGALKFNITSGTPTIAAGVTATVASGATLELAGTVSALGTVGGNCVHITNNSTASGAVVSGTNQVVGAIDGTGNTQVNTGSDLTADHIIQNALIIGGAAGSSALVTVDASDATGNPLGRSSGIALAGSPVPSGPFDDGVISSANLSSDLTPISDGSSGVIGNASQVPEPSTLLLALLAILGVVSTQLARHHFRCQTV